MAYVDQNSSKEKATSGIAAIVVVGVIGYAMVTGLAMRIVHIPETILVNHTYEDPPAPPPKRLPPQHVEKNVQQRTQPIDKTTDVIPIIDIPIDRGILPRIDPFPPGGLGDGGPAGQTQQQVPGGSSGATAIGHPGDWVTTEDYPSGALRAGKEGRTGVRLGIGTDGRPTDCTVTQTSGSDDLDRATCHTLMRKARFVPARNAAGDAIASSYASSVLWRIPAD